MVTPSATLGGTSTREGRVTYPGMLSGWLAPGFSTGDAGPRCLSKGGRQVLRRLRLRSKGEGDTSLPGDRRFHPRVSTARGGPPPKYPRGETDDARILFGPQQDFPNVDARRRRRVCREQRSVEDDERRARAPGTSAPGVTGRRMFHGTFPPRGGGFGWLTGCSSALSAPEPFPRLAGHPAPGPPGIGAQGGKQGRGPGGGVIPG